MENFEAQPVEDSSLESYQAQEQEFASIKQSLASVYQRLPESERENFIKDIQGVAALFDPKRNQAPSNNFSG